MKLNRIPRSWLRLFPGVLLLLTVSAANLHAGTIARNGEVTAVSKKNIEEEEKDKSKSAKKTARQLRAERKASPVKLSPDLFTNAVHVTAKDNSGEFDFYVFSLDGTLVAHHKMKAGDKKKISGLQKGEYVYRVFSGDREKTSGSIEIRN